MYGGGTLVEKVLGMGEAEERKETRSRRRKARPSVIGQSEIVSHNG